MSKDQEIRELFKRHNVPIDRDDIWAVQGTPVVKHKALERLAAAMSIIWERPQVLLAERDAVAVLVSGMTATIGYEWSIGEAVIGQNYKVSPKVAAYPYAMAEKRGKDRVILKLAGLQGVYSEEEADDFKSRDPEPSNAGREPVPSKASKEIYIESSLERIAGFVRDGQAGQMLAWAKTERAKVWPQYGIDAHDADGTRIVNAYKAGMQTIAESKVVA